MKQQRVSRTSLAAAVSVVCSISGIGATGAFAEERKMLEEVVVTAQKREQNLQEVPVAVSAFSALDLVNSGTSTITELQKVSPNTTLQVSRGTNTTLTAFVRGVGQQDPLWGFEPGVGIYVDDVYIARPQGAVLDVYDVERIEILRGPQGTLYGKNTIGGAVKYVTRRMTGDYSAFITTAVGTHNQADLIVGGQMPLIQDKLYVGASVATLNRDGYGDLKALDKENGEKDIVTGRFSVEYTPTTDLFMRLALDQTNDTSNAIGGFDLTAQTGDVHDSFATAGNAKQDVDSEGAALTIEYQLSDALMVKSITAYREGSTKDTPIDFDVTPIEDLDVYAFYEDRQFSQEIQLNWSSDNFSFVGGVYYYDGNAAGAFDAPLAGGAITLITNGDVQTESESVYGDLTYDITDRLSVFVGGRYTSDEKTAEVFNALALGSGGCVVRDMCPPVIFRQDTYRTSTPQDGGIGTPLGALNDTYNDFSPRIGISYQMSDDVNIYGGYSEGFKSGGFDMRANERVNADVPEGFDPEDVNAYEVGLKGEFFDNRLRLNVAAFYMDYEDLQAIVSQAGDLCDNSTLDPGPCTGAPDGLADTSANNVRNIGEATLQGLEFEALAQLSESFSMNFSFGYIDTEIDEFLLPDTSAGAPIGATIDVADQRDIQNTPDWTGHLKFAYDQDWGSVGNVHASVGVSYRGETQIFEAPSPLDTGGYSLWDASVTWVSADEHWNMGLHGKNLGDKEYRVSGYNFVAGSVFGADGITTAFYGAPRTVTLTAGYRF